MFYPVYGTTRFWYKKIDETHYEIIKLVRQTDRSGRMAYIQVLTRSVNIGNYDARTIIDHWIASGRNYEQAFSYYNTDIERYKGDMAYRIGATLGINIEAHRFNTYEDLSHFMMYDLQARQWSTASFINER